MAKLERKYRIRPYHPKGANDQDGYFDLPDDISKTVAKAAAAERLIQELKYDLWPKIFEQVQRPADKLLWKLYEHEPRYVDLFVRDKNNPRKRLLTFSVEIKKVEGAHSNTAGKFVVEIFIGDITVYFNDIKIAVFEPRVGSCTWTFLC